MGFDFVPGALAGALALREAGPSAVRVDVGYFSLGMGAGGASAGTRESLVGATLNDNHAFRDGRMRTCGRPSACARSRSRARTRAAISVGGAEHFTLPARPPHAAARSTSTSAGSGRWPSRCRPATLAGSVALQAARRARRAAGRGRAARLAGGRARAAGTTPRHAVVGPGDRLRRRRRAARRGPRHRHRRLRLHGLLPRLGRAERAAGGDRPHAAGAVGPVEAFGLDALEQGCRGGRARALGQRGRRSSP